MENEQLVVRIQAGEDAAGNMLQLWEQNQHFIISIAVRFSGYAEMDDLQQEGYISLCNAVRHYDNGQGVPFINYAALWIKQGMRRYIENCCGAVRIPSGVQADIKKYKKISNEFRKEYGRDASDWEMGGLLGMSREKLNQLKKDAQMGQIRSLSEPVADAEGDITLGDTVASGDDLEAYTMQELDAEVMKRDLWIAVDALPGNLPAVIRCRFLDGKTLQETGQIIGVSKDSIRCKQEKALRTLKQSSRGRKYRIYYEEYISAAPVFNVGVESFQRTWTSSTELAALQNIRNIDREHRHEDVERELDRILEESLEQERLFERARAVSESDTWVK